ncbi:hypothetical protein FNV43_RR08660 [Rhamnella rubrinervis]|uniref:Uncharacterized protein n=1 Tax=Rhamnella rubrinervis TaxID=2594499 RepID=A0A8K0MJG6_9ROSA|nr:hypothetical protein FNV43_RR08660 [Rhamnella rubrinervis]
MEELSVVMKKFGDEQSTLLDQFERMSFEIQLNQAMLGRSLSEPGTMVKSSKVPPPASVGAPPPLVSQVRQGRTRGSASYKFLKKLLRPIFAKKGRGGKKEVPDPKDPAYWKAFSRSMRY